MENNLTPDQVRRAIGDIDLSPLQECISDAYEVAGLLQQAAYSKPSVVADLLDLELIFKDGMLTGYISDQVWLWDLVEDDPNLSKAIDKSMKNNLKECFSR